MGQGKLSNTLFLYVLLVFSLVGRLALAGDATLLGAGDVVKITVYGQPDLTTVTRIAESNKITFPLIGDVTIGGLSTANAENKIGRMLTSRGFVKNAQVNIFVEQRLQTRANTVTILGQVDRPGKYSLESPTVEGVQTLVDLLAASGGTGEFAADYLMLIKKSGKKEKKIRVDLIELLQEGEFEKNNYKLEGGDVVFVPEMDVFYIYGQVQRPGRYRLVRDMTVMQALSVGGGITDRGSEKGIQIKRRVKGSTSTRDAKPTDRLFKDDVIYVKESLF
jgi:polysaccharide export outer membrane protein